MQIRDDSVTGWRNQVDGARALVASGTRVGLLGGYGLQRDRLVVGELAGQAMRVIGEYRLVLPNGGPLPAHVTAIGRGAVLHVVTADYWYQLSLEDVTGQ